MADLVDIANDAQQQRLDDAISSIRNQPIGESREDCEECGGKIPAARRKAVPGVDRCTQCQQDHERRVWLQGGRR